MCLIVSEYAGRANRTDRSIIKEGGYHEFKFVIPAFFLNKIAICLSQKPMLAKSA